MSDELTIDLSNYKDKVGSRVTPGRYKVLVEDVESTEARSGNKMINLWFNIQDGEFKGQTIVDRLVLTENSLFRVVGFMQALGLPTPKKRLKLNLRLFVGKVLEIDVEDGDPYNGRVKSEVRGYSRIPGANGAGESTDLDLDTPVESESETVLAGVASVAGADESAESIDLDKIEL